MIMDCVFCKIVSREIPARIVYEDDSTLAFLDIVPTNPGHTLVIPKTHHNDLLATPSPILAQISNAVQRVAGAIARGMGVTDFNIIQNNGAHAGQVVKHLHFHIIPRRHGDGFEHWKGAPYATEHEADSVAAHIKAAAALK